MAKEYFMPLFSVRASKSNEAHKQSLLMEKTHAKLQESGAMDKTKNGFPKSHIKPRKNNFVLVNAFPNPAHVLKEGITEEEGDGNSMSSITMTPSSSSYGLTHLFKRSKKVDINQERTTSNDTSGDSTEISTDGAQIFTKSIDSCANDAHIQQQQHQKQQQQQQHKHKGLRKLYKRSKKRKNGESTADTSEEYISPNLTSFISYNEQFDLSTPASPAFNIRNRGAQYDVSTPASPAFNIRNRSTSTTSSSYFNPKHGDVESFDTTYSTSYHIEDDDICSINTSSTKRMKSDKRSNSVVSLVSIADSPGPNTPSYPTLRSVTSRNRLLSVSSPSMQPPTTSTASSISLSSTPYYQPQKSPSVQFHIPQKQATRSRSSSSAPMMMTPLPLSSIRTSTPITSFSTPTTSTPIPVTKGMNLDGYLSSLEAQRVQNIVSEQQQQILKQQLHHNDPIIRNEFVQAQTQALAQVQTEEPGVDPDMLVKKNDKVVDSGLDERQLQELEELAGLELMDLDEWRDTLGIDAVDNADDVDDSVVQEIDQLINLARLEEFVREMN